MQIRSLYLYIKPKTDKDYDRDYMSNQIRQLIGEFFADVNSDIYIPKSDIVNLIKTNVEGVDGVNAYFLSEMNETALQTKQYVVDNEVVTLSEGENPNLGLDNHGNIYLESDNQFPVLMGGWDYLNSKHDEVDIIDPLIIVFE